MSVMFDFKSVYSESWKHLRDARVCKRMLAVAMAGVIAGCSTLRYGGAPEPSFDVDKDLEQLAKEFEPADSISKFYKFQASEKDEKKVEQARDKFITGRITMMNIRYIQFIRSLTSEKALLDTATALLTLGLNLAGTSVGAASTKTVLAAISAGMIGSKEAVDKNYFFDKTIPALVSQMNAERKKALVPLLLGIKHTLDDYPFAHAVTDLNNYYMAGTFTGAIQGIQADAAAKEKEQDEFIATLTPITMDAVIKKREITVSIRSLRNNDEGLKKINDAITALEKTKIKPIFDPDQKCAEKDTVDSPEFCKAMEESPDFRHRINRLQGYVRGAGSLQIDEVKKAFSNAGIKFE